MRETKSSVGPLLYALLAPVGFAVILVLPATRALFFAATAAHPYVMGFGKFALLATAGEVLAAKVSTGAFRFPKGGWIKALVWGLIGLMMTLLMPVYTGGVQAAQAAGVLVGGGNGFLTALFTSIAMNATFGIAMMAFHRVTDTVIELRCDGSRAGIIDAVSAIDWPGFVGFVVLRAIPLFWIPAHTVTFLMPAQYRVFLSAVLSIVLGLLQAMAKRKARPAAAGAA